MKINKKLESKIEWVESSLLSNEEISDEHLRDYLKNEGGFNEKSLDVIMEQRSAALKDFANFKLNINGIKW